MWVVLRCCLSLAADLHFSNTLKVKHHVNGLYTCESLNVDHRGLLLLDASPDQRPPPHGVPDIRPLSWLVWTYRSSPVSTSFNVAKECWPQCPKSNWPETMGIWSQGPMGLWWAVWPHPIIHVPGFHFFSSAEVKWNVLDGVYNSLQHRSTV